MKGIQILEYNVIVVMQKINDGRATGNDGELSSVRKCMYLTRKNMAGFGKNIFAEV